MTFKRLDDNQILDQDYTQSSRNKSVNFFGGACGGIPFVIQSHKSKKTIVKNKVSASSYHGILISKAQELGSLRRLSTQNQYQKGNTEENFFHGFRIELKLVNVPFWLGLVRNGSRPLQISIPRHGISLIYKRQGTTELLQWPNIHIANRAR